MGCADLVWCSHLDVGKNTGYASPVIMRSRALRHGLGLRGEPRTSQSPPGGRCENRGRDQDRQFLSQSGGEPPWTWKDEAHPAKDAGSARMGERQAPPDRQGYLRGEPERPSDEGNGRRAPLPLGEANGTSRWPVRRAVKKTVFGGGHCPQKKGRTRQCSGEVTAPRRKEEQDSVRGRSLPPEEQKRRKP